MDLPPPTASDPHLNLMTTPVRALLKRAPVVLPPTVLGFYLLVMLGPNGPGGQLTQWLGWGTLPFTFAGLVVGSMVRRRRQQDWQQRNDEELQQVALAHGLSPQWLAGSWSASASMTVRQAVAQR